jgi:hypothetical protein
MVSYLHCTDYLYYTTKHRCDRQSSGPHFSALVILLANIILSPTDPSAPLDLIVATESLKFYDPVMSAIQSSSYEPLHRFIQDLYKHATAAIGGRQATDTIEADVVHSLGYTQGEMDQYVHNTGYFGLDDYEDHLAGNSTMFDEILDPFAAGFAPSGALRNYSPEKES